MMWRPYVLHVLQTAARELDLMQYADYYIDRRDPRRPRFCKHCKSWKPERAHHCSVMGRCVLKMVSAWCCLSISSSNIQAQLECLGLLSNVLLN